MSKRKKQFIFLYFVAFIIYIIFSGCLSEVRADELSDTINNQLNNLNLSELENFFNSFSNGNINVDFASLFESLLSGNSNINLTTFFDYITSIFLSNLYSILPTFLSIIAIGVMLGIVNSVKGSYINEGVYEVVVLVFKLAVALILLSNIISEFKNIEIVIKNIAKLSEIMAPIIITLMVAIGSNVSVAVYKPAVLMLSNGVINLVLNIILPLVVIMTIFNVVNAFSTNVKFEKFSLFITSTIKWILGIVITIFSLFLSIQGLTSAHYDGVSIKLAKYTISNSVPIIGGFLKDGFDIVVAGSAIIKNAVGFSSIIILFYIILSPLFRLIAISILLKLTSALIEPICDSNISNFCLSISTTITYLIVSLLSVGFMFFILVILMTLSGGAFI